MRIRKHTTTEGLADACTVVKESIMLAQRGEEKTMQCTNTWNFIIQTKNQSLCFVFLCFVFVFEAEKFFKDAVSHQIYEGVCINNSPSTPGYLMNSRAEFEQGSVARVVVTHGM